MTRCSVSARLRSGRLCIDNRNAGQRAALASNARSASSSTRRSADAARVRATPLPSSGTRRCRTVADSMRRRAGFPEIHRAHPAVRSSFPGRRSAQPRRHQGAGRGGCRMRDGPPHRADWDSRREKGLASFVTSAARKPPLVASALDFVCVLPACSDPAGDGSLGMRGGTTPSDGCHRTGGAAGGQSRFGWLSSAPPDVVPHPNDCSRVSLRRLPLIVFAPQGGGDELRVFTSGRVFNLFDHPGVLFFDGRPFTLEAEPAPVLRIAVAYAWRDAGPWLATCCGALGAPALGSSPRRPRRRGDRGPGRRLLQRAGGGAGNPASLQDVDRRVAGCHPLRRPDIGRAVGRAAAEDRAITAAARVPSCRRLPFALPARISAYGLLLTVFLYLHLLHPPAMSPPRRRRR